MRARVLLDHEAVATGVGHTVHAMVEVAAAAPVVDRPPVTLMVAMDTSGSMAGDRIDTALECVRQLVRQLGPRDRLGLVTFGTEARVRFGPTVAAELDLDVELGRITASGSTNLSAGWLLALDTATSAGGQLHRVIVLSDGHANCGITDHVQLAQIGRYGFGKGVSTSTIGLGDGVDESLLTALADSASGGARWAADSEDLPAVFQTEFDELMSVVAQNLTVRVSACSSNTGVSLLNDVPRSSNETSLAVIADLGDVFGGETRRVVFALELEPLAAGVEQVATVSVRWVGIAGDLEIGSVDIPIEVRADAGGAVETLGGEVRRQVVLLRSAADQRRAQVLRRQGLTRDTMVTTTYETRRLNQGRA